MSDPYEAATERAAEFHAALIASCKNLPIENYGEAIAQAFRTEVFHGRLFEVRRNCEIAENRARFEGIA